MMKRTALKAGSPFLSEAIPEFRPAAPATPMSLASFKFNTMNLKPQFVEEIKIEYELLSGK